jgi:hypothetical protein
MQMYNKIIWQHAELAKVKMVLLVVVPGEERLYD